MGDVTQQQRPALVRYPHPWGAAGREMAYAEFRPGETLRAYIQRVGIPAPRGAVAVWHNGHRVPDALWERLIPRAGDQVIIRARNLAGRGGAGKVLRIVAMVVLIVVSYGYGAALGGAMGFTGAAAGAVGSSVIMLGGTLLINALLPPPKPTFGSGEQNRFESSPTYSISGGRNRMRPYEPMLLVFGEHKVVPDLASQPYTEYVENTQFLAQAFHFGLQFDLEISEIRIGESPIEQFHGLDIERSPPDGSLSMISGNVDILQGFDLLYADGWSYRTTPDDTQRIDIDIAAQVFAVDQKRGTYLLRTVDLQIEYRKVGAEDWIPLGNYARPVYATHYWSLEVWSGQQVEYGSTNPNDHYEGERTEVCGWSGGGDAGETYTCSPARWTWRPHPGALGGPWSGFAPNPLLSYTPADYVQMRGASPDVSRRLVRAEVEPGRYEIRIRKLDVDIDSQTEKNSVAVAQIRCVQTDNADYTGQARMAVRIRASSQLNGAIAELNAICRARCLVWNGSDWETQHSRNPAWWFLWFARGYRDESGNLIYGAGLRDVQIDVGAIIAWAAWCDARRLTFDYVLDRKISAGEMLGIIARAGRASPTWQSGRLGAVWDAADLPVVAMFGPANIRAGTFAINYINEGSVDEIVVNFADRAAGYQMGEVRVRVPGASVTQNPLQLDFEGCTEAEMAGREANLLAASQVWHRRRVSWESDIEGFVATRGDVVQISHDLTVWGYSGRLRGRDGDTLQLDAVVASGGSGIAMLRDPDGNMRTVSVVSDVGDVEALTIVSEIDGFPLPGDADVEGIGPQDWMWFFDPLETPGRRFKITEVRPTEDGVKFAAIDDDPGYYASESNPYIYAPPRDGKLLAGVVLGVTVDEQIVSVAADQSRLRIEWAISISSPVAVDVIINGQAQPTIITSERSVDVLARTDDVVDITVTPRRTASSIGESRSITYVVQGLRLPLPAVEGLTSVFRDGLTVLRWQRVVDVRNPGYEVRIGPTWADSMFVARTGDVEVLAIGNGLYHVAARFELSDGSIIYGPADRLQISGAALVRNVIVSRAEAPTWDGTVSDGGAVYFGMFTLAAAGDVLALADVLAEPDVLWLGGPAESGIYTIAEQERVDIGYVAPVRVDFDVSVAAYNTTDDVLTVADVLGMADVLDGSRLSHVLAVPQIRHAQEPGEWSEWRDYVPGLINARYFDVRLILSTDDPQIIPAVTQFVWAIDVPDLIQHAEEVVIPVSGLRVTYSREFHARPNVQVTILDALDSDQAVVTDSDAAGFSISIIRGSTPVERKINWLSQGY